MCYYSTKQLRYCAACAKKLRKHRNFQAFSESGIKTRIHWLELTGIGTGAKFYERKQHYEEGECNRLSRQPIAIAQSVRCAPEVRKMWTNWSACGFQSSLNPISLVSRWAALDMVWTETKDKLGILPHLIPKREILSNRCYNNQYYYTGVKKTTASRFVTCFWF